MTISGNQWQSMPISGTPWGSWTRVQVVGWGARLLVVVLGVELPSGVLEEL